MAKKMVLRHDIESAYNRLFHAVENRPLQERLDLDLLYGLVDISDYDAYICPDCGWVGAGKDLVPDGFDEWTCPDCGSRRIQIVNVTGDCENADCLLLRLMDTGALPRTVELPGYETEEAKLGFVHYPEICYYLPDINRHTIMFKIDTVTKYTYLIADERVADEEQYRDLAEIPQIMNRMVTDLCGSIVQELWEIPDDDDEDVGVVCVICDQVKHTMYVGQVDGTQIHVCDECLARIRSAPICRKEE